MKKFLVVALLMISTNAFAFGDIVYNDDSTTATAIAAPVIPIVVAPITTQGQLQGQGQVAVGSVNTGIGITMERPFLAAPGIGIPETNFITGEIQRYNLVPILDGLDKYANEKVVDILYYNDGNVFSRVTPEEIPAILIEQAQAWKSETNKRYDVICRKASHTLNLGTGGASSLSGSGGTNSSTALGIVSGGWSVANAYCTVWVYKVK